MDIHSKIDKLRKQRGWSLSTLATKAGVTPTTVYNWFNDNHATPTRESIENVCSAFGISVASFYADVEMDKLTEQEIELLELFRKVPDKKKSLVLTMIQGFGE